MNTCCHHDAEGAVSSRFGRMIENCREHAVNAKENGHPVIGILCEFTPRELIMAAGGVPVCLCGGAQEKIPPAEKELPAGLCPLIKSTYGYHITHTNPFLEMADLLIAETTCDGKKKMFELMSRGREMYVLELPQKPDDSHAREHWLTELKKLRAFLQERFKKPVSDDDLRGAVSVMNRERSLRRRLARTMKQPAPPWTGRQLLGFKSIISGIKEDIDEYRRLLEHAANTKASRNRSTTRVLLTGVPTVHGAEKVVDIIENAGGLVVCMENCTGLKPILEDVSPDGADPLEAIAEKYFHLPCSVMTENHKRMELLKQLIQDYQPECIVDLIWQGCLTYDVESYFVKQLADAAHLGYLKIVTDYSPSDAAQMQLRIEALLETSRHKIPYKES